MEIMEMHNGGFRPKEPFLSESRSRKIILVLLGAFVLYMLGFAVFFLKLDTSGRRPEDKTDAIITLTGETKRITEAVRELATGSANWLYISGVYREAPIGRVVDRTIDELKRENKLQGTREAFRAKIQMDSRAENTIENGLDSRRWVRENKIGSIRLMTSYYHMPRSMVIFRKYMPDIRIVPHSVLSDDSPWSSARIRLAFSEYNKYMVTLLWTALDVEDSFALRVQRSL
jgi:uncharacterized SAM-binding protein YcdF (DUF218 family)